MKRKKLLFSSIKIWLLALENGKVRLIRRALRSLSTNTKLNLERSTHTKLASKYWKRSMRIMIIIECLISRVKALRMLRLSSKKKLKTLRELPEQKDSQEVSVMVLIHRIWFTFSTLKTWKKNYRSTSQQLWRGSVICLRKIIAL